MAYILTDDDNRDLKNLLDFPTTSWKALKIVLMPLFPGYLNALDQTIKAKGQRATINAILKRWNDWNTSKTDDAAQPDYPEFDDDFQKILQYVAQKLQNVGTDNGPNGWNLQSTFETLRKAKNEHTMERVTALHLSIALELPEEKARELLYTAVKVHEQDDFNPRRADEMLCLVAIQNRWKYPDFVELLRVAQIQFMTNLFGEDDRYEDFVTFITENKRNQLLRDKAGINILDVAKYLKTAVCYAAYLQCNDNLAEYDTLCDSYDPKATRIKEVLAEVETARQRRINRAAVQPLSTQNEDLLRVIRCIADYLPELRGKQLQYADKKQEQILQLTAKSTLTDQEEDELAKANIALEQSQVTVNDCEALHWAITQYLNNAKAPECQHNGILLAEFLQSLQGSLTQSISSHTFSRMKKDSKYNDMLFPNLSHSQHELGVLVLHALIQYFNVKEAWLKESHKTKTGSKSKKNSKSKKDSKPKPIPVSQYINAWKFLGCWQPLVEYLHCDSQGIVRRLEAYRNAEPTHTGDDRFRFTLTMNMSQPWETTLLPEQIHAYVEKMFREQIHIYELYDPSCVSRSRRELFFDDDSIRHQKTGAYLVDEYFYSCARYNRQIAGKEAITRADCLKFLFWKYASTKYQGVDDEALAALKCDDFLIEFSQQSDLLCCSDTSSSNRLDEFIQLCLNHTDPIAFLRAVYQEYRDFPGIF